MSRHRLKFELLPERFTICRLPADAAIPAWAVRGMLNSITRTTDELSIICPEARVPADVNAERGWKCLKLKGPISFSETGVLTAFVQPLSDHAIPIFVLSTHDTDYVLVKEAWLKKALQCLRDVGHDDGTKPGAKLITQPVLSPESSQAQNLRRSPFAGESAQNAVERDPL